MLNTRSGRTVRQFLELVFFSFIVFATSLQAQSLTISPSQIDISVVPSFDHAPLKMSVTSGAAGFSFADTQVSADASWVSASKDTTAGQIVLTLDTDKLTNQEARVLARGIPRDHDDYDGLSDGYVGNRARLRRWSRIQTRSRRVRSWRALEQTIACSEGSRKNSA